MVGPSDVRDLQVRIRPYFSALEDAVGKLKPPLALDQSQWSGQAWVQLSERVGRFLNEEHTSDWNPLAYLDAGASYERGRQVLTDLDAWRDELARRGAPNVPAAIAVPHADIGPIGGLGFILAAVVAILLLKK